MEKDYIEKVFEAKVDNMHDVLSFIDEQLEMHGASMKAQMTIDIAVEEMYVNIAKYAYGEKIGKCVVAVWFTDEDAYIQLVDSGMEFNPLNKKDPDVTLDAEDRNIGGLGIYMVKKSMDECAYQRIDGLNIFVMRKTIK